MRARAAWRVGMLWTYAAIKPWLWVTFVWACLPAELGFLAVGVPVATLAVLGVELWVLSALALTRLAVDVTAAEATVALMRKAALQATPSVDDGFWVAQVRAAKERSQ